GGVMRGRMRGEQGAFPPLECLERRWRAPSPRSTVGRQGRLRAEGHILLRALCARDRRDVAEIRGRKTGKLHNDAVPLVVHREAPSGGKEVPASRLGQRLLAHLQRAQKV